jgi:hypothetical protein
MSNPVSLTGSHSTLIANICALIVASVVAAEGAYIESGDLARYLTHDAGGFFLPVFVMFIVRNRRFSLCFLAVYVLLSIKMLFQARNIYFGTYVETDPKFGPLSSLPFLVAVSVICLVVYAVFASVRFAITIIKSPND